MNIEPKTPNVFPTWNLQYFLQMIFKEHLRMQLLSILSTLFFTYFDNFPECILCLQYQNISFKRKRNQSDQFYCMTLIILQSSSTDIYKPIHTCLHAHTNTYKHRYSHSLYYFELYPFLSFFVNRHFGKDPY